MFISPYYSKKTILLKYLFMAYIRALFEILSGEMEVLFVDGRVASKNLCNCVIHLECDRQRRCFPLLVWKTALFVALSPVPARKRPLKKSPPRVREEIFNRYV